MVSPEMLTDGSLNHNHADNTTQEGSDTNTQVDNSNTNIRIEGVKQPSYLNLACCISGYTTLTTYNSKQREGFRSRDISPARIPGLSPHTPPVPPPDDGSNPAAPVFSSVCGNFLSPQPRYLTDMDHRKKSGDKMWNGNSSNGVDKLTSTLTSSSSTPTPTSTKNSEISSFYCSETRNEVTSSLYHKESTTSQTKESCGTPGSASSFILQRVERLYGPGALAQGFYTRRSLNFNTPPPHQQKDKAEEEVTETSKESPLPVLRLLRPEFRAQLSLAKRKSSTPICSPNRPSDSVDGAVERIIPIVIEANNKSNNCKTLEERETAEMPVSSKDGHYYLKIVVEETERLERLAAVLDADLETAPEHMEGRLRAAAGKARLLASQKLAQFKGLCHKNLSQDTSEDFPTTCEDLAGFWDMVYIQVASIHEEFEQIDALRKAGWPEQETVNKEGVKKSAGRRAKSATAPPPQPVPAKSSLTKARDEARKRMLAERRRQMRNNSNTNDDVLV